MTLIALIAILLSGNTQVLSAVKARGGDGEEGGGGGGAGHRPALSRQQKAVRQICKTASKQCPSNHILNAMFVFSISQVIPGQTTTKENALLFLE